jgi:hypothetical protein
MCAALRVRDAALAHMRPLRQAVARALLGAQTVARLQRINQLPTSPAPSGLDPAARAAKAQDSGSGLVRDGGGSEGGGAGRPDTSVSGLLARNIITRAAGKRSDI